MNFRVVALLLAILYSSAAVAATPTADPVTISGTTEVGFTLTGSYTYGDVEGHVEDVGATSFRWLRDGSAIGGETSTTYTLVGADEDAMIEFEVTPVALTNELLGAATLSPAVGPIAAANTAPTVSDLDIGGTTEVGFLLTGTYDYDDDDGDADASTFRWLRGGVAIGGATGTTYTLVGADSGETITFEVTARASAGVTPGNVATTSVGPIDAANTAPTATGLNITGTTEVGFVLTGNYTYNDADGDTDASTFRWFRNNIVIGGATAQTYTLVVADETRNIHFEVTPRALTGVTPGTAVTSVQVGPIGAANTAPTVSNLNISGTTEVGFLLTGTYDYNDADLDADASTFRWLRGATPIGGATGTTYTLVGPDSGQTITFEVTARAAAGVTPGNVATTSVGPIDAANTAPTVSNLNISGTTEVGFLLTGTYDYNDADLDADASTFRWLRGGAAIGGATGATYTLVGDDSGETITFEVTARAATGVTPGNVATTSVGPIAAANTPPVASNVSISGTAEVGFVLTGTYTYFDADNDNQGISNFRWLRNGTAIGGATSINYLLVSADEATNIAFEVTPVAQSGVSPGLAVASGGFGPIAPANTAPTASNVAISGTLEVGFTLTGSYSYSDADNDAQGASTFSWLRNGAEIGGANGQSYLLVEADENTTIVFEVIPVAATGVSPGTPVQSAGVGPILPANTAPTASNVSISGNPALGDTLTGTYTYTDADDDLESGTTFRWLREGAAITGATGTTYVVVTADIETTLVFEVTPAAATGVTPGVAVASAGLTISNSSPSITGQDVLSIPEDTSLTIELANVTVSDLDSVFPDDFTLTVQDGTDYTRAGNTITPVLDFNGELTVPVIVNDGFVDSPVFDLLVSVTPENDQPLITGQEVVTTPEDIPLTVLITDIIVADPDNVFPTDFTLTLLDGANYTRVDNDITPLENFNGTLDVPVTVSDGLLTSNTFSLQVEVSAVNDLPALDAEIGAQNAVESSLFTLDVSANFSDADLETLTYTATGLPASGNIVFDNQTGVFSGTPLLEDTDPIAVYDITVTATDAAAASISDIFQLTISALDRANVSLGITVAPDPAMLNDELRWTFTARNPLGPQTATNVELEGSFVGDGLTIAPSGTATCTIQPAVGRVTDFVCTMGTLPVAGTTTVVLTTSSSSVGDVLVFATAAGTDAVPIDPNPIDNSRQVAVGVAESFSNGAVQILGSANVRSVAAGDVNGDGAVDLIAGTVAGQPIQIYLSAELGGDPPCECIRDYLLSPISLNDLAANEGVALADFDGNGTLDLAVANGGGMQDMVYSNDGLGNFTPMRTLGPTFSQGIAVGDFDNNGRMDLAIATVAGNPVYLGNGSGGFTLHATLGNANSLAVAVGRFDNNAREDLVFANTGADSRVWTKNGGPGFTSRDLLPIGDASSVTVGEFGADARPDLAFGRVPVANGDIPANPVLLNDGTGRFGTPVALLGGAPTNDILAGDVNEDGADDLVFVSASGVHQIWLANGSGFDLHSEQIVDSGAVAGVLTNLGMADTADTGGVDLAMGGANAAGLGVYLNDSFGNLGRGDAVIPVLTLLGEGSVSIASGLAYNDSGASADDNIGGNISASIVVNNPVNTAVVGSYTITYDVTDFAGNAAVQITRTVNVTPSSGTGGGGGGSITYLTLLFLLISLLAAYAGRATRSAVITRTERYKRKDD